MTEPLSNIPAGMRYYFGREARLRRAVEDAVMRVFDGWGYEEIATPTVDYYALFERGMGRDEASRSFRFTDADGRLLALRPDVTSAVARAAATLFASSPRPLRFCYAASVFRERPRTHAEWRRQSRQLGCELIGAGGADADLESLVIASEIMRRLGLNFRVTLNHVGVFKGITEHLGLEANAREHLRQLIDARDSSALKQFLAPLVGPEAAIRTCEVTRLAGGRDALSAAREISSNALSLPALDELGRVWSVVESLGLTENFGVDLADVSGLDYYTGLVFKIYVEGTGARVGSGGRYDELTANFGRREPAIGFVLDLDAITEVLARGGDFESKNGERAFVSIVSDEDLCARFREAKSKRERDERIRME
jgi:ATP phosphoribosyltransferase regulatory subunit